MTGSHVGTGETRRHAVLLSGRPLWRFLLLDQEVVGAFAPQPCTDKWGLIAATFRLISAGVALVAKRPVLSRQAVGRIAGRAGQVARVIRPLARTAPPGQGKVNAQPVLPPPFGLLALGLPLALVVLVRDDRNRLLRLREEPSPHTVVAKIAPDMMSGFRISR